MSIQNVLATVVLVSLALLAHAGGETPPGVKLGMTVEQAQAVVPSLTKVLDMKNFSIYTTKVLPLSSPTVEAYRLVFSLGKLVRIKTLAENITNDAYGAQGKSKYAALRATLIQKYGEPTHEVLSNGKKGFTNPEEFWVCLSFPECGEWVSQFKTSAKVVSMRMEGFVAPGKGEIEVVEESVPEFSQAIQLYLWINAIIDTLLQGTVVGAVGAIVWKALAVRKRKLISGSFGQAS